MKYPYCMVEIAGGKQVKHEMASAHIADGNLLVIECEADAGTLTFKKNPTWIYAPRGWLSVFQSAEERADA